MARALRLLLRAAGALLLACLLTLGGLRAITRAVWPTTSVLTIFVRNWSNSRMTYVHFDAERNIVVDSADPSLLPSDTHASWSPDGRTLAVALDGPNPVIGLFHPATWTLSVLPQLPGDVYGTAWLPDGTQLVVAVREGVHRTGLMAFPLRHDAVGAWVDGPASVLLENATRPAWSPDEKTVAVIGHDAELSLWTPATGARRYLGVHIQQAMWTQNGQHLVARDMNANRWIWLRDIHNLVDYDYEYEWSIVNLGMSRYEAYHIGLAPSGHDYSMLVNQGYFCQFSLYGHYGIDGHVDLSELDCVPLPWNIFQGPAVARWRVLP